MDADIDCVAITDHNSGAWIDELRDTYEGMRSSNSPSFRELHLFPGVELSVNAGFHLLAIFDVHRTTADIDTLLGAVAFSGTKGDSNDVTQKSPVHVVEAVLAAGGIPVPAHTDRDKGLLKLEDGSAKTELDADTVRQVLSCKEIIAMEVIDRSRAKPRLYDESGATWTEVVGSDCHSFRDANAPGSRYTWVKMEVPSLEGLLLALMDGTRFSIRHCDDPSPTTLPTHFVESVELADLEYMGRGEPERVSFNPRLNALVGGRGTGKSTVVHALRLAARRESELEHLANQSEPRLAFERFNRVPANRRDAGALRSTTRITCTVMRDRIRHRVHWPGDDEESIVEEQTDDGKWRASSIQAVTPARFPIRIFSQGQIAALAGEDQQALLQVIDDAAGGSDLRRGLEEAHAEFRTARDRIRELDEKLKRRVTCLIERQDVERKLQRFEEAGNAEVLKCYRRRSRQRREVDRQFELAESAATGLERQADSLLPEDLPAEMFDAGAEEDQQAVAVITQVADAMRTAAQGLRDAARGLIGATAELRTALTAGSWQEAVEQAEQRYAELVSMLQTEGVGDPSEYGRLVQDRQRLDGELALLDSMQEERTRLTADASARLERVLETRRAVSKAREEFLTTALRHNAFVSIQIRTYGNDPQAVERSLRLALNVPDDRFRDDILVTGDGRAPTGVVARLFANVPTEPAARSAEIEARISHLKKRIVDTCAGAEHFGGHFNNYLKRESERTPELIDRVLAWFPEDGLNVEYSRSGDGDNFQPIGQASAGQRSAAMLAFLLAHGEEPLVLDQPEDDLDNQLIYDLIVRQIREQKLKRQIIIVTHNANVVVNGDAEMLHVLDFRNQCFIRQKGSLQHDAMRAEVCRVMEGGREAFDLRYRRLGLEPADVR